MPTLAPVADELRIACLGADLSAPLSERVTTRAEKKRYVRKLGVEQVGALATGANDETMLRAVALGIGVVGSEGTYGPTLRAAWLIVRSPLEALDLLLYPQRLAATLRP